MGSPTVHQLMLLSDYAYLIHSCTQLARKTCINLCICIWVGCSCICCYLLHRCHRYTRSALDEILDKHLQLLQGDVWHHHHMCNVPLTGKLPLLDKCLFQWSLKDNRAAELIQHSLDPNLLEHRLHADTSISTLPRLCLCQVGYKQGRLTQPTEIAST